MPSHGQVTKRDLVVIGCSAGGVEALPRILQQLPTDLRAAILIVQHLAESDRHQLASLLARASQFPVEWAEQGARIVHGRAYVAPPGAHLLVVDDHIRLTGGARENHARPSIDKLFRAAAAVYGSRTVGVLLTGMLDDGVAGLCAIRDVGGVTIVQDPGDAMFSELPGRAVVVVQPERVLPIDAIGGAICAAVGQDVQTRPAPSGIALEAAFDRESSVTPARMDQLGTKTSISCPECHGPLWQVGDEELRRYRCYLGHVTTARDLLVRTTDEVESALWSAVRALNDRANTLERLAEDAQRVGGGQIPESYTTRAKEARQQAELARRFLLELGRGDLEHRAK